MSDVLQERTELRVKVQRLVGLLERVMESDRRGWLIDYKLANEIDAEIRSHGERVHQAELQSK